MVEPLRFSRSGIGSFTHRENAGAGGTDYAARRDPFRIDAERAARAVRTDRHDRLISGSSRAVIVVEASEKSGSLDTAERARKQGRLVYAVPGSGGTEALLKGGATRLDAEGLDFDALADTIYAYRVENEKSKPPSPGTLF